MVLGWAGGAAVAARALGYRRARRTGGRRERRDLHGLADAPPARGGGDGHRWSCPAGPGDRHYQRDRLGPWGGRQGSHPDGPDAAVERGAHSDRPTTVPRLGLHELLPDRQRHGRPAVDATALEPAALAQRLAGGLA